MSSSDSIRCRVSTFSLVEDAEVLLALTVEVQPGDRFAVVVVDHDGEVGLGVTMGDASRGDLRACDRLDDVVALQLLLGGHDLGVSCKVVAYGSGAFVHGRLGPGGKHRWRRRS